MDNKYDDLWQGGPWEQPAPVFDPPPAVRIPPRAMQPQRPVLRARGRRRKWPWCVGLLALIGSLLLFALFLDQRLPALTERFFSPKEEDPWVQEERYDPTPPAIPQAATGTGVTLTLHPAGSQALTYTQIYDKNAPSVVSIESASDSDYSTGTGIILTEDGYIVTNAHVVAGAREVLVYFSDNSSLPASLVGFAADEDLAVLKVEAAGLTPAEFGDSGLLRCGDPVAALGDPLGYRSTITEGIVSALDREVEVDGIPMNLIQTSAAINFGNSGGPLLNQYGQVVGITTIKIVTDDGSAESLGFAIPSQRVKFVVDALIDGRAVKTGVFGFTVRTTPAESGGLEIIEVDPRSDAWAKGLQAGDVLTAANGQAVTATRDLVRVKQTLAPGDLVSLTYLRDGVSYTVDVALVDSELISR